MIYLSQLDSRWATTLLGWSKLTVGRYGCTTTCLSMASDYYGAFKDPKQLATALTYTTGGYIIWDSVEQVCGFKARGRFRSWDTGLIDGAIQDPQRMALLEVNGVHWVVGIRRIPLTNHYIIADPLTGKLGTTYKYGTITGGMILTK